MKTYRMTDAELEELKEASKPVPYMVIGGVEPASPREKAMAVWHKIANRVGCDVETVGPSNTGNEKDFDAEPL